MDGSEAIRRHLRLNIFKQTDLLKILEAEYPTVAQIARDVLAISATRVGVKRLFNVPAITVIPSQPA
jgi:hAT family protein